MRVSKPLWMTGCFDPHWVTDISDGFAGALAKSVTEKVFIISSFLWKARLVNMSGDSQYLFWIRVYRPRSLINDSSVNHLTLTALSELHESSFPVFKKTTSPSMPFRKAAIATQALLDTGNLCMHVFFISVNNCLTLSRAAWGVAMNTGWWPKKLWPLTQAGFWHLQFCYCSIKTEYDVAYCDCSACVR